MYAVSDLMTQDVTAVGAEESLAAVQRLWGRAAQRYLPVLEAGRPIGILSRAEALAALRGQGGETVPLMVRDVMRPQSTHVRPGTPLRHAATMMLKDEIRSLPVVDEGGQLVGVLTDDELLRFALDLVTDLDRLTDGLQRSAFEEEMATG